MSTRVWGGGMRTQDGLQHQAAHPIINVSYIYYKCLNFQQTEAQFFSLSPYHANNAQHSSKKKVITTGVVEEEYGINVDYNASGNR
eukprot:scaffold21162_cov65-Attheya_sp.AAC.12